jgi:hypothetical protein
MTGESHKSLSYQLRVGDLRYDTEVCQVLHETLSKEFLKV